MKITAHCLIKNEENFISPAIKSVVGFVDKILVFDTGSTDGTVNKIKGLMNEYPGKIIFEEKGDCDKKRHTDLRNEMIEKTTTEWLMILDGDEIWTNSVFKEAFETISENPDIECLMVPFHLCVGDVFHETVFAGSITALGKKGFFYQRFLKKVNGVHWGGEYGADTNYNNRGEIFFNEKNTIFLKNKFWHATHLVRSSVQTDYSSGKIRKNKLILSYFLIGKKIKDKMPDALAGSQRLGYLKSVKNFFIWVYSRLNQRLTNN